MPCPACGAGLSQPRIDYGLTTCHPPPSGIDAATPGAGAAAQLWSGRPSQRGRRPAPRGAAARDEAAQRERLEAFHQQLTDQVLALADGPSWKAWLATAAKFHHYSFNNTVAIFLQRPDATQVAGYRTWQSLGRQVRKGEQGIQILAPVTRRAASTARG